MASRSWHSIINFISYIAIAFIGLALILTKVGLSGKINDALELIATILAYVTVAFCSFIYANGKWNRNKNNIWYMVIWVVAVVLIVLAYVI